MPAQARLSPDETRERILAVAEEQFRRVGYGKTAVADIAAELRMSPANVYRFFPSKSAINQEICARCLAEAHALIEGIARGPDSAAERIERLVLELHRFNKSRYTAERRIHDMVTAAMEENWPAIEAHFVVIHRVLATLVEQGIAAGEFPPQDAALAALTFKNTLASVMHPALIASCGHDELENQAVRLARFGIAALKGAPDLPPPAAAAFPVLCAAPPTS